MLSCLLSFDCSFCLIAWYLYFLLHLRYDVIHVINDGIPNTNYFSLEEGRILRLVLIVLPVQGIMKFSVLNSQGDCNM